MLLFVLTGLATAWMGETRLRAMRLADRAARQAAAAADRADEERERAEDEAAKAEEAAAEAELAAQEAAEALDRQLEAEAALRRSQMELTDFFENATIGLSWIGPDDVIQRANRAQLAMLGCAASGLRGPPVRRASTRTARSPTPCSRASPRARWSRGCRPACGPGRRHRDVVISASALLGRWAG